MAAKIFCVSLQSFFIALVFASAPLGAQTASLKINSDLVIHPSQVADVFMIQTDKINKAATWDWPSMEFAKPYKTWWNQVRAVGPFTLNVHTELLNAQEMSFELYWQNPSVSVGEFLIKDTIVKDMGGAQVIIQLEGSCAGLNWRAPGGLWKVRGRMSWGIVNQELVVQWKEFEFFSNPSAPAPVTTVGPCQGPAEIQEALKANVASVTQDQAAMQELLRKGILAWMNNSIHGLKTEVMKPRSATVKPGLDLFWDPQFMVMIPGGMIRVPGYLTFKRQGVSTLPGVIDRTLTEQDYSTVTESGFILPQNVLEQVTAFAYNTGDLTRRYKSTEIKGFQDLMNSPLQQSAVWPDLERFSTRTLFYFDLFATGTPQMSNQRTGSPQYGGGILYDVKAPVLINSLAPARGQYLNYVDFRSTVTGGVRVSVKSQKLNVQTSASSVPLSAKFRPEYKAYREVDERIDTSRLGTAGKDFLNGKSFSFQLPQWNMGQSVNMVYGDLKIFKQSVMLPVTFQKK